MQSTAATRIERWLARGNVAGKKRRKQSALLERHTQRFHELKRGLDQIEYFCKGTVLKRMMKCGKAGCACAADPDKRHGPYFELTYKANGKTVNVKLSPEAAPLYNRRVSEQGQFGIFFSMVKRTALWDLYGACKTLRSLNEEGSSRGAKHFLPGLSSPCG